MLGWISLSSGKHHAWKQHYGTLQEHTGRIPRDFWLEDWEKQAILDFQFTHPLEGTASCAS